MELVGAAVRALALRAAVPKDAAVIVVGAGPAGMATALGLARRGISSTVLEGRAAFGTRLQLLNLNPDALDALAQLGDNGKLLEHVTPVTQTTVTDITSGAVPSVSHPRQARIEPDLKNPLGDMAHLLASADSGRVSGRIPIGVLENDLRALATEGTFLLDGKERRFSDFIQMHFGTKVTDVEQDATSVGVKWKMPSGTGHSEGIVGAVKGAYLVHAAGGRQINGLAFGKHFDPEAVHFLGGAFPTSSELGSAHAAETVMARSVDADGRPLLTVAMTEPTLDAVHSPSHSIVWTQVSKADLKLPVEAQRAIVRERAASVGIDGRLLDSELGMMPVRMQVGEVGNAVEGRALGVGDTNRSPYFRTSTGAASALAVDAPNAVEAIAAALGSSGDAERRAALARYADQVRDANNILTPHALQLLARDLGVPPPAAYASSVA